MDTFSLAQDLAPQLDATAVTNLMYIACNEGSDGALSALLPHDACNTKLLTNVNTGKMMAIGFRNWPAAAFLQQQQQQQQETMQQPPQQEERRRRQSALLHEQLVLTCLVAGHVGLMHELLKLKSAAGNLSEFVKRACLAGVPGMTAGSPTLL
jgi:uncharacterized membrane protein YebE (DUF533 family)